MGREKVWIFIDGEVDGRPYAANVLNILQLKLLI